MAEGLINLSEGSGKKQHTYQRVVGANTVEDSIALLGIPYLATYQVSPAAGVSTATPASHLLQIMAGASLDLYVARIVVYQLAAATAAAIDLLEIVRLSTAGTGGTALTPARRSLADAAYSGDARTLPGVKGTEADFVDRATAQWTQTIATQSGGSEATKVAEWNFVDLFGKPLRIAAGTANGIAVKNPTARAGATVIPVAYIIESNQGQ